MAGSETPVNPSSESSQHLKEDETPQSSLSEDRKITSEPYQCCCLRESKKEEPKKVPPRRARKSRVFSGYSSYATFPLLDEDLIGGGGGALDRDYGGGTRLTINRLKSNLIQSNIRQVPNNDTPASSTDHPNQISNIEATSRRVPNNDTPASCHLSTDHPNQGKAIGSCFSWFRKGKRTQSKIAEGRKE